MKILSDTNIKDIKSKVIPSTADISKVALFSSENLAKAAPAGTLAFYPESV